MQFNKLYRGDCLDVIKTLPENSIDSIITDPPYELGFMGKSWDNTGIANNKELWKECLRVLKPGGHLLAFSGTRTYHRMACAIEDAGFEVRDMIEWVYGSGFPKSLNISKKLEGVTGKQAKGFNTAGGKENFEKQDKSFRSDYGYIWKPTNENAKQWEGWGTALKPAHEPICMARKPLAEKTVVENVLKYGTGGINIETSRVTSNSPALQNNQDYENVCNEFSYIQQSFLSSLSDTFFLSHELSQGYLKHIFFVLSPYNNCDTITLHTEVILAHTFDKGLQDALCDYDLKVQNVNEYVQSAIKAPNFQDDYPTLFSFCDALLQKKAIPFKDIVALSNDVQVYISDFISSLENITPSYNNLLNSFFVVFPYIVMLINKSPTLYLFHQQKQENVGRFPANLIHDNSEEVRECFPETKSTGGLTKNVPDSASVYGKYGVIETMKPTDSGNASRFFKSIIYNAKASKSERNKGCEELEDSLGGSLEGGNDKRNGDKPQLKPTKNYHPTVKPIALMEYLIKMMTREGQIVLDPFGGSGTTGVACKNTNRNYILIEKDEGYCDIIEKRLPHPTHFNS